MRKLSITLFIVTLLSSAAFSRVSGEESKLAGVWINTNDETRSCPKFEISFDDGGAASFVWWGKTHPEDSRYGPFPMSISGSGATAEHITKYMEMQLTVELKGRGAVLKIETRYKDDSGRKDFEHEEKFTKE